MTGVGDDDMPFRACVDCRHCRWPSQATGNPAMVEMMASCHHPLLQDCRSVVTGETGQAAALTTRIYAACGELGLWWEPRDGEAGA